MSAAVVLVVPTLLEPNPVPPHGWLFHSELPGLWIAGRVHSLEQLHEYVGLSLAQLGHGGARYDLDLVILDVAIT